MMNKSKIDWCDFTWNPVTGCPRGCFYCYAAKQSRRFCGDVRLNKTSPQIAEITTAAGRAYILEKPFKSDTGKVIPFPAAFAPTFHRYRLASPAQKKKPASIFVCSMGDLFAPTIPTKWIVDVFDACAAAPWHSYLFLTKYPQRYKELDEVALLPHEKNFWFGTTVTRASEIERIYQLPLTVHRFASVEPILEGIDLDGLGPTHNPAGPAYITTPLDWLIVGAETGNRKGKRPPENAWLRAAVGWAHRNGVPVLLKDSAELRAVWGKDLIQQFPAGLEPMKGNDVPHCTACELCSTAEDGDRGTLHFCFDRRIPGRYVRTSPPWCQKRKENDGN